MKLIALLLGCLIAAPASAAESLGRLFFSPQERVLLDKARKHKSEPPQQSAAAQPPVAAEPPPPPPPPENLSVNGLIKRSDGRSTIWINGKPVSNRTELSGGRIITGVGSGGRVAVRIPDSKQHVELKVGQHLDGSSGAIRENLSKQPERFEANIEDTESLDKEDGATDSETDGEVAGEEMSDPELADQAGYETEMRDRKRREAIETARAREPKGRR
jgi:hypothetical protein